MEKLLYWFLQNRNELGLSIWILGTTILYLVAIQREWIYTRGRVKDKDTRAKELQTDCDEKEALLAVVNEKFTEQRILNERATVTVEGLKATIHTQELELARLRGVAESLNRERARVDRERAQATDRAEGP